MVGILVISHGRLAEALISSVESFVGKLRRIRGIAIWPKDQEKEVKDRIQKNMAEVNDGEGVVILTDILGGTPTNLSLSCFGSEKVEVVTGVNLPMLLAVSSYQKLKSMEEISRLARKSGRRSITLVKKLLELRQGEKWKRSCAPL
jgi:mannose PTS system EIIA component